VENTDDSDAAFVSLKEDAVATAGDHVNTRQN
jgi:hypothetical protein